MNDFTKEELDNLRYGIHRLISEGSCDSTWNADIKGLKNKLDSMIDSYCEHKDIRKISDADYVTTCCDCGEIIDYE